MWQLSSRDRALDAETMALLLAWLNNHYRHTDTTDRSKAKKDMDSDSSAGSGVFSDSGPENLDDFAQFPAQPNAGVPTAQATGPDTSNKRSSRVS